MNIEKKLALWRERGLLDDAAAARIAAFERGAHRPILLYALGGLGSLTLGIGVVSLIASNWSGISRTVKLGGDLAIAFVLAAALFVAAARRDDWLTEVLAGVYYVFVLASIALVGQVYQLGSPQYQGLLVWSVATAPFMLLVRRPFLATVWLAGLVATEVASLLALLDWLDERWQEPFAMNVAIAFASASVFAYLAVARSEWMRRERPLVSATWTRFVWTALVGGTTLLCFAFYSDMHGDGPSWGVAVAALLAAALASRLPDLYPEATPRARAGMRWLLYGSVFILAAATAFPRGDASVLGALLQLGYLALAAWTVLAMGSVRSFNLLTGLIALRILGIYIEVFGSLFGTGLGMIGGGVLTLLLAWAWRRKTPELAERLMGQDRVA